MQQLQRLQQVLQSEGAHRWPRIRAIEKVVRDALGAEGKAGRRPLLPSVSDIWLGWLTEEGLVD